jgi:hypothetical protein
LDLLNRNSVNILHPVVAIISLCHEAQRKPMSQGRKGSAMIGTRTSATPAT